MISACRLVYRVKFSSVSPSVSGFQEPTRQAQFFFKLIPWLWFGSLVRSSNMSLSSKELELPQTPTDEITSSFPRRRPRGCFSGEDS